MIRLSPPLFFYTPLGEAEAHFLFYQGTEVPAQWGCIQRETKEWWFWPNHHVRACESISFARDADHSPIYVDDALLETLWPHIQRHEKSPLYARAAKLMRGEI